MSRVTTAGRSNRTATQVAITGSSAFQFVLTIGLVNLFADTTYEGGASINGPFLGSLGATAAAISIVAGVGEFLGYSLRSLSGYLADKTGRHWLMTFIGYAINLLAVPAMALASSWQAASCLILAERIGRAIRKPTVEAMLSFSTGKHGKGWVYAVNTAMDETGAVLGPLLIALVLYLKGSEHYQFGYVTLLAPAILALIALTVARLIFPLPSALEEGGPPTAHERGFTRAYWLYMTAGAFFAAGLMSYEFISYHLGSTGVVSAQRIPLLLSFATVVSIAATLVLGRAYDRAGIAVVVGAVILAACFSPLVFLGGSGVVLVGLALWGVGYATQDTLLKALIASVLPKGRRNLGFGVFYLAYGGGWLVGSIVTGLLYEHARVALIAFAVITQLVSIPFFVSAARKASATDKLQ